MHPARLVALVVLTACATARPASVESAPPKPAHAYTSNGRICPGPMGAAQSRSRIAESGGELNLDAPLESSSDGKELHVVAMIEVPGDTRLQPALAMADAQARAELTKSVRVGIATAFSERTEKRGDTETQTISRATAEVSSGVLPALSPPVHGWRRIQREDRILLQVASRLTADRKALINAIHHALRDEPDAQSLAYRAAAIIGTQKESP